MTALGALRQLHLRKMRVPEDVSLVGFDDLFIASYTQPPLTTVRQPRRLMGRLAMESLLQADIGRGFLTCDQGSRGTDRPRVHCAAAGEIMHEYPKVADSGCIDTSRPGRGNGLRPRTWSGFEYLQLQVRRIPAGETLEGGTDSNEMAIVALGGTFRFGINPRKMEQCWVSCERVQRNAMGGLPSHSVPALQLRLSAIATWPSVIAERKSPSQPPSFNPRMCELKFGEAPTRLARSITSSPPNFPLNAS